MPRSSGTYSLPANTLAVSGTTISSTYYNAFVNDVAAEITASLPRDGQAGMTGKLLGYTGSASAPSFAFTSDATTGLYRKASGEIGVSILGTLTGFFDVNGWNQTGAILGRAYTSYATNADITGVIPSDDTLPQITEGTQIMSVSYTPKSITNRIRVRVAINYAVITDLTQGIGVALFDGATDAIAASVGFSSGSAVHNIPIEYEYVPGVLTAKTYSVRVGSGNGTPIRLNGTVGSRVYGGAIKSTLVVEEIVA